MEPHRGVDKKEKFEYFFKLYTLALCQLNLGNMIYGDYIKNPPHEKTLAATIIDALFSSAAINTYKILDNDGSLNLRSLVNQCNKEIITMDGKPLPHIKVKYDKCKFDRLKKRRNKTLAHSDIENIEATFTENYPLYIGDIKGILDDLAPTIAELSKRINGSCICGIARDTGKEVFLIPDRMEKQYNAFRCQHILHKKMIEYLKEYHPEDLLAMIYSQEDINDGQA